MAWDHLLLAPVAWGPPVALGRPALTQDCQVLSLDYSGAMEALQEVRVRLEVPAFQGRLLAVNRDLLVLDYLGQKCLFLAPLVAMPDQVTERLPWLVQVGHRTVPQVAVEAWGQELQAHRELEDKVRALAAEAPPLQAPGVLALAVQENHAVP